MLLVGALAMTCARVWLGPGEVLPRAVAQIPDSGMQRKKMLDEIERTNELLERILDTLRTQTFKVSIDSADEPKDVVPAPRTVKP